MRGGPGIQARVAVAVAVCIAWSLQPIGSSSDATVQIRPTAAQEKRTSDDSDNSASSSGNGTWPCDRYLRSADVAEVRNPRNHKFVTSNGWTERHRPRPEISVYSRIEELPPQAAAIPSTAAAYYHHHQHQQQRDGFYPNAAAVQQLPPTVRTSKRIIYYATLPDVVRPPAGYPPPLQPSYSSDPFALGPGPFSADFRHLDSNRYKYYVLHH